MALVARVRRYLCEQGRDLGRRGRVGLREARRDISTLVLDGRLRELRRRRGDVAVVRRQRGLGGVSTKAHGLERFQAFRLDEAEHQ